MKRKIMLPCSLSIRFLTYGFFAVLAQLVFILLNISIMLAEKSFEIVKYIHMPYFEYPLICFTLVIGGSLLFDYITLKDGI